MVDRSKVMRLRGAIEGALLAAGDGPTDADGLVEAEASFRAAIIELLKDDPDLLGEFENLSPIDPGERPASGWAGEDLVASAARAKKARLHISSMSGWLKGTVDSLGS